MQRIAAWTAAWIAVAALTARAEDARIDLTEQLTPHVGAWQRDGAQWRTSGEAPPAGWYLRSARQYDMKSIAFEVRIEEAGGFAFLHLSDWRIELRPNEVVAIYQGKWGSGKPPYRHATKYFYHAARPIDFTPGTWHSAAMALDGERLAFTWDGTEVLSWRSPQEEWLPRVQSSGRVRFADEYEYWAAFPEGPINGRGQTVVFQALRTGGALRHVSLTGIDAGEAQGFTGDVRRTPFAKHDTELERLAPQSPVAVDWSLAEEERDKAAALPAVAQWDIPEGYRVDPKDYFGEKNGRPMEAAAYFVGAADPGKAPTYLHNFERSHFFGSPRMPSELRVYFNLAEAGDYTLKYDLGNWGIGWGPNVLEMRVDGRAVSRELYRPFFQHQPCSPVKDYVPLKLAAGPHRVDIVLSRTQLLNPHHLQRYLRIPCQPSLVRGLVEPVFDLTPKRVEQPQSPQALADPPEVGERNGKVVWLRVRDLPADADVRVTLGFQDIDADRKGDRLMDVYINGVQVADDFDAVAEAGGWNRYVDRSYNAKTASLPGGETGVEVKLVGVNFKAFLNYLRIADGAGKTLFEENCGWHIFESRRYRRPTYTALTRTDSLPAAVEHADGDLFDGHNLIVNPHFDVKDEKRDMPAWWWTGFELRAAITQPYPVTIVDSFDPPLADILRQRKNYPNYMAFHDLLPGDGVAAWDDKVGHDRPGALRVARTDDRFGVVCNQPATDFGKTQALSVWVRAEGASGKAYPEIIWLAADENADMKYHDDGGPLMAPRMKPIGRSTCAQHVTGTSDWTQLTVREKPPFGAVFAMPVIRVDGNAAGTFWIDDVEMNGYGDELLEVSFSRLGYHPRSDKHAVVKSLTDEPVTWRVVDEQSGKPVAQGVAAHLRYEWFSKRHYFTFDFTDLVQEGRYRIEVSQGDRSASSPPVAVSRDVYRELSRMLLHGLWIKRWNDYLPTSHSADALEDGHMLASMEHMRFCVYEKRFYPKRRNMLGGWYDAGDDIRHTEYWPATLLACAALHEKVAPALADRTGDDAWAEMVWGAQAMPRYLADDGQMYAGSKPGVRGLDNVPFYDVDRYATGVEPIPQTAGACAKVALLLRDREPALSRANLDVALANYAFNRLADAAQAEAPTDRFMLAAQALLAETYLAKVTDDPPYAEPLGPQPQIVAEGIAADLPAQVEETYESNTRAGGITQVYLVAACAFVTEYPQHPQADAVKQAMRHFADAVAKACEPSVYGQAWRLPQNSEDVPTRWCGASRMIGYWPSLACNLAQIGVILDDPAVVRLAERQLQFCLGKNMLDASAVHGVSDRMIGGGDQMMTRFDFFRHWLQRTDRIYTYDGLVPTMSFRDFGEGTIRFRPIDDFFPPVYGAPKGYCVSYIQPDYPTSPGPSEVYLPHQADFALAAASVHAAMKYMEERP